MKLKSFAIAVLILSFLSVTPAVSSAEQLASVNTGLTINLAVGSRHNSVRLLQAFLTNKSLLAPQYVTGYYGPLTAQAVKEYQAMNNLPQVGKVGPLTRALINAELAASPLAGRKKPASPDDPQTVISDITVNIANTAAFLNFKTNKMVTFQVLYGLTNAYGSSTTRTVPYSNNHFQTLIDLTPETTYHYQIKVFDSVGNVSVSSDSTFTTSPTAPAP